MNEHMGKFLMFLVHILPWHGLGFLVGHLLGTLGDVRSSPHQVRSLSAGPSLWMGVAARGTRPDNTYQLAVGDSVHDRRHAQPSDHLWHLA